MVAQNTQTKTQATVKDVVCPDCFQCCSWPSVTRPTTDKYGRTTRTYYGWCEGCGWGFEVIQFEKSGRWIIHRYRYYDRADPSGTKGPARQWQVLAELPEAPVVMTGPGGDFCNPIELKSEAQFDEAMKKILQNAQVTMNKLAGVLMEVMNLMKLKKQK